MTRLRAAACRWLWCRRGQHHWTVRHTDRRFRQRAEVCLIPGCDVARVVGMWK